MWQNDCTQVSEHAMCMKGMASPALLFSDSEDCRILVHGDDFGALGDEDTLRGEDDWTVEHGRR